MCQLACLLAWYPEALQAIAPLNLLCLHVVPATRTSHCRFHAHEAAWPWELRRGQPQRLSTGQGENRQDAQLGPASAPIAHSAQPLAKRQQRRQQVGARGRRVRIRAWEEMRKGACTPAGTHSAHACAAQVTRLREEHALGPVMSGQSMQHTAGQRP